MLYNAIFDMDGLMIDSESVFVRGFVQAGEEMGYCDVEKVCKSTIGVNSQKTREIFLEYYGDDFDYDGLRDLGRKYISAYYAKNGVPIKKGLFLLLEFLKKQGMKLAVATSTSRDKAMKTLFEDTKIGSYFDAVVCGDMVSKSKPNPEIYLKAAECIKAEPSSCYVFEDSVNGIKAAYAAGMKPIMIPDLLEPTDEIRPMLYACFSSLEEALNFMKLEIKP